jgi:hypothetical protein
MAFSPPVTLTSNTPILATDLNLLNDAARKYINKQVNVADLATDKFDTTELVKGEYYNVVPDHQFTTGDVYTQNVLSNDNGGNRQYFSSTIKPGLAAQWVQTGQYQIIGDTGKSVYFEQNNSADISVGKAAKIIITGHLGVRNWTQYVVNTSYTGASTQDTRFYLMYKAEGIIDAWTPVPDTIGQVLGFEEYENTAGPTSGTNKVNDRRTIPFLYEVAIDNKFAINRTDSPAPQTLAYRFAIGLETTIDMGWITSRFVQLEVFYA